MYKSSTEHVAPSGRRHDLDTIRVWAFCLLIFYHIGMFYVPWDWHVNSLRPQEWLKSVMWLTNPWRLSLLFLVSGAATRLLLEKYRQQGPGAEERLAGSRLSRLGLPLLFGILVVVPPQTYYEVVQHVRDNALAADIYHNALTSDFWLRYITSKGNWCDADGCIVTPTWNHLWFVAYLLFYGLIAAMVCGVAKQRMKRFSTLIEKRLSGAGLFIWPIAYLALIRIGLYPRFPVTHDLVEDVYTHALNLAAFALGFVIVSSPRVTQQLIQYRHLSLGLALASYAAFITYMNWGDNGQDISVILRNIMRVVYAADQWCFIAAILGYAARHIRSTSPLIRYLSGGVFTFYIVHQTLIVFAAANLEALNLPLFAEMGMVFLVTISGSLLAYELAKRIGIFGVLLGVSASKRPVSHPGQNNVTPA